ncbi:MAG: non-heme iron oxygenase ferredoxin subunit [Gammaproteobacteria bacterium]|nr:non-heme iron oxygenase ferredoxin subunit [Gammaproteobacteria bacterium]
MSEWIDVSAEDGLRPGEFEVVESGNTLIAVFNVNGDLHAIEDICTHDGEELTGGPIEGDEIICPRHGARFCLRTGAALTPPAYDDVTVFPVRVENGRIQVLDDRDL